VSADGSAAPGPAGLLAGAFWWVGKRNGADGGMPEGRRGELNACGARCRVAVCTITCRGAQSACVGTNRPGAGAWAPAEVRQRRWDPAGRSTASRACSRQYRPEAFGVLQVASHPSGVRVR